jgi:hypothetical protein
MQVGEVDQVECCRKPEEAPAKEVGPPREPVMHLEVSHMLRFFYEQETLPQLHQR